MADCRHEWVLGSDGCVHCGDSWAQLHPEEELASPARRGLNRLLGAFPTAEVYYVGAAVGALDLATLGHLAPQSPWLICDLEFRSIPLTRRFAIWKTTGDVYELDEIGAVGDDPIITL
jgi:hypothetical protein